jgi:hypothetical protein
MELIKSANLLLRFLLELGALAALGYWGYHASQLTVIRVGLALGAPLVTAVIWGIFVSPNASVKLPGVLHLSLQVIIFGLAAAALVAVGRPRLGAIFALLVIINAVLMQVWDQ